MGAVASYHGDRAGTIRRRLTIYDFFCKINVWIYVNISGIKILLDKYNDAETLQNKQKKGTSINMSKMDRKTLVVVTSICAAFVVVFALAIVLVLYTSDRDPAEGEQMQEDVAGVWIASVANIDFPSSTNLDAQTLRGEIDAIVDKTAELGLNTIYFQVRPCADALYNSKLFPVSAFLSQSGELPLDTLEYMVETAHKAGIAVHAWLNPLRVTTGGGLSNRDTLREGHPALEHPEWVVEYADGKLYFDCGVPAVRELIAAGVQEIIENYDVDGIVFDDYFYPYPQRVTGEDGTTSIAAFADEATFSEYGEGYEDMGDWRRDNVNNMIKLVYDTVKKADKNCLFGVAPFGIWKNGYGDESGSETRGAQSYSDIYCDTLAWIRGGYIDYVAPQIYWRTVDSAAPYDILCDWWAQQVEGTDVRLLICHAAYRYESDWENPQGIMTEQVAYAKEKAAYSGSVFYGYDELRQNTNGIADEVREMYAPANTDADSTETE